jgi:hypothetical protein
MYGYNTAVVIKNAIYDNRLFYGVTTGIGIDIPLKKSQHPQLSFELLVPIRKKEAIDYASFAAQRYNANKLLPVAFSMILSF